MRVCGSRSLAAGFAGLLSLAAAADDGASWTPVPFRVRNLTFPTVLVMGFKPAPVVSLPAGVWAAEVDLAVSNNFQMSAGVEAVLERRGGPRRPLDENDVAAIAATTEGVQFLVDGEFRLVDIGLHYGLSDDLDLSLQVSYLGYGGGVIDPVIWDFHDTFGFGQAGREYVADNRFQVLFAAPDGELVLLDRPTSGGFTDPVLSVRWAAPGGRGRWRWGLEAGFKLPVADSDRFLSTGSVDYGAQVTVERRWRRDALILNLALVVPGRFDHGGGFEPADLPALDVAWVHRVGRQTSAIVQVLFSENIFREMTDSDLSEAEFQLTTGLAWPLAGGRIGVAATENLFHYDNTPDFALHLSYGRMFGVGSSTSS